MERVLNAVQKVLEDEKLTSEFLKLEDSEKMYEFLSKIDLEITKEEFEKFADGIKDIYSECKKELTLEELNVISGGKKLTHQLPAMFLSVLTLISSTAIGASELNVHQENQSSGITQKFKDEKNWALNLVKKHPGKSAVGGIVFAVALAFTVKEVKDAVTVRDLTNALDKWWELVHENIEADEFKNMVHQVFEALVQKIDAKDVDDARKYLYKSLVDSGVFTLTKDEYKFSIFNEAGFNKNAKAKYEFFKNFRQVVKDFALKYLDKEKRKNAERPLDSRSMNVLLNKLVTATNYKDITSLLEELLNISEKYIIDMMTGESFLKNFIDNNGISILSVLFKKVVSDDQTRAGKYLVGVLAESGWFEQDLTNLGYSRLKEANFINYETTGF